MSETHPHLGGWMLAKPAPGKCPECAVDHAPEQPHDQQSMAYQYDFYGKNGRWPTWTDAMAHCSDDVKKLWTAALKERGINL